MGEISPADRKSMKLAILREIDDIAAHRMKLVYEYDAGRARLTRAKAGLKPLPEVVPPVSTLVAFLRRALKELVALFSGREKKHLLDIEREAACWILIKRENMTAPSTNPAEKVSQAIRAEMLQAISEEMHQKVWQFSTRHMKDVTNWAASCTSKQGAILARSKHFSSNSETMETKIRATEMAAEELWSREHWKIDDAAFADFEQSIALLEKEAALSELQISSMASVQIESLSLSELHSAHLAFNAAQHEIGKIDEILEKCLCSFDTDEFENFLQNSQHPQVLKASLIELKERRDSISEKLDRLQKNIAKIELRLDAEISSSKKSH